MGTMGIWVAEAYWSAATADSRTVRPIMEILSANDVATSVHRHMNDEQDLIKTLTTVGRRENDKYSTVYIASHGSPGTIDVGDDSISLTDLAGVLPGGILDGKLVHFGSCSVLRDEDSVSEFVSTTGARAATGFTTDVGWVESAAFDLLMLATYARYSSIGWFEKAMAREYGDLTTSLGFTVIR